MNQFHQLLQSDSKIIDVSMVGHELLVNIRDWREFDFTLKFIDHIGVEAYSPEEEEISHGSIQIDDPLINKACTITQDVPEEMNCYVFWSAWTDQPILKVVAKGFELITP